MNKAYYTRHADTLLVCIDGKSIANTQALFQEFNRLLEFPDYFGNNFDALDDMLHDLSWLSSKQIIIYFFRTEALLSAPSEQENKTTLMDILRNCNNPKLDIILSDSNIQFPSNV